MEIDYGAPDDASREADTPTSVLEILSPSTTMFDRYEKLEEYRTALSLEYILLVDPDYPQIRLYRREADRRWTSDRFVGLDTILDLPLFDLQLPLNALYSGPTFRPRPTLMVTEALLSEFGL